MEVLNIHIHNLYALLCKYRNNTGNKSFPSQFSLERRVSSRGCKIVTMHNILITDLHNNEDRTFPRIRQSD